MGAVEKNLPSTFLSAVAPRPEIPSDFVKKSIKKSF
jgi:hypothetical protein